MPDEGECRCDQCNGYENYIVTCDVCEGEGATTVECPKCLGEGGGFWKVCSECDNELEILGQCSGGCVDGQIEKECDEPAPHTWTSYTCSICGDAEWNIRGDDERAMIACEQHEVHCKHK
jgi:hypothetical protein